MFLSQSEKDSKDQESIQSSTTPFPGYHALYILTDFSCWFETLKLGMALCIYTCRWATGYNFQIFFSQIFFV